MKPKPQPVLYRGNPDVFGPHYAARLRAGEVVRVAGFMLTLGAEREEATDPLHPYRATSGSRSVQPNCAQTEALRNPQQRDFFA